MRKHFSGSHYFSSFIIKTWSLLSMYCRKEQVASLKYFVNIQNIFNMKFERDVNDSTLILSCRVHGVRSGIIKLLFSSKYLDFTLSNLFFINFYFKLISDCCRWDDDTDRVYDVILDWSSHQLNSDQSHDHRALHCSPPDHCQHCPGAESTLLRGAATIIHIPGGNRFLNKW